MTIEESNILIARFMGAELDGEDWHISGRDMTVNNRGYPGNLKYHSSWDWLMPVIERISLIHLIGYEDRRDVCHPITFNMPDEDGKPMFRFKGFSLHKADTLIEAAYSAVIEVIEFVNSENNTSLT